jgi:hypothetical protein
MFSPYNVIVDYNAFYKSLIFIGGRDNHSDGFRIYGRIILIWDRRVWPGLIYLRIGTSGGPL